MNDQALSIPNKQSKEILILFNVLQNIKSELVVEAKKVKDINFPKDQTLNLSDMRFYRVEQLSFDEEYPHREAFENVLLSLENQAYNFVYILTGTDSGIELHIGVVKNRNDNPEIAGEKLSAANCGDKIENIFTGNFGGSVLKKLKSNELQHIIDRTKQYSSAGIIMGIPSVRKKEAGNSLGFQGIDRLINSMRNLKRNPEWQIVVVCEPVSRDDIQLIRSDVYDLYNRLALCAKQTLQAGAGQGESISFGDSVSQSKGRNIGYSKSSSMGRLESRQSGGNSRGSSQQDQSGTSEGTSSQDTTGKTSNLGRNSSISQSITFELANKHAQELMKYIDEELLPRLKSGYSRGMFQTSVYYMAKDNAEANRLKSSIITLFQGDQSTYSPLRALKLELDNDLRRLLGTYQNQYITERDALCDAMNLMCVPFSEGTVGLSTYLTAEEVSLLAGLPQNEVLGLPMREGINFGLNVQPIKGTPIELGKVIHRSQTTKTPFSIDRDNLSKHTFVTGVTGSGKTTTCHHLLSEADCPFLVIEPAKTEYRALICRKGFDDLVVFTIGNESVAPFRINPFELVPGEVISSHIDMVKATFTTAFPMEASMPQLLEEAIYQCYKDKCWDVNGAYQGNEDNRFPTLSDLLGTMNMVVKEKNFGERLQNEYIGSLVSRLSNLTMGAKGEMLNCEKSVDFEVLIRKKVVLELEELRSSEDKALIMGFILSRLAAVIRNEHKKDMSFRHLTLIEEAHRLLSKAEYGDSGSKKGAVEVFTDLLAEVRKYGEGLIVVDQIPNKLAPEVLKNTNTKIVHKLLARDDKEAIGDTMLMDDKQKEYLSALKVGTAVIFTEQTDKPVHVAITEPPEASTQEIEDELVIQRFQQAKDDFGNCWIPMEIAELYPTFNEVAAELAHGHVDTEKCKRLRGAIADTCKNGNTGTVWQYLIHKRNRINKRGADGDETKCREQIMLDFFTGDVFNKEDFSEQDIHYPESRTLINSLK